VVVSQVGFGLFSDGSAAPVGDRDGERGEDEWVGGSGGGVDCG
jgi:hypothetical protein